MGDQDQPDYTLRMNFVMLRSFFVLVFVLGLGFYSSPATASTSVVKPGHSAAWFNPDRVGEGWVLEISGEGGALLYWFTYDDTGEPRWLLGVGEVGEDAAGRYVDFPSLLVTEGGRFGANFDPDEVTSTVAGSAGLRFSDCDHGTFSATAFGHSQVFPIERLSKTMAAGCDQDVHGTPGFPAKDYAGQSGSWYDPGHDGEGFVLQWLSHGEALIYWFSYDPNGKQYWMFGLGRQENGEIVVDHLLAGSGARFGDAFNPDDVVLTDWGSLTLGIDCNTGQAHYDSLLPGFNSGNLSINRLTSLAAPDCPWTSPTLTELYEVEWTELSDVTDITAYSVANDGTIAGIRRLGGEEGEVVIRSPGADSWHTLTGQTVWNQAPVWLAPSELELVASGPNDRFTNDPFEPALWFDTVGWMPMTGAPTEEYFLGGASEDLSQLVGSLPNNSDADSRAWRWSSETGLQFLNGVAENGFESAIGAANDGSIVIGNETYPVVGTPPPGTTERGGAALRWRNGQEPEFLTSTTGEILATAQVCDQDCSVVAGRSMNGVPQEDELSKLPWFWTRSGEFGILGSLPEDAGSDISRQYEVLDISTDGSLIVGRFRPTNLATPQAPDLGFIWSQYTGMVSTRELQQELEIVVIGGIDMAAVSVSPSAEYILLRTTNANAGQHRIALLKLTPR